MKAKDGVRMDPVHPEMYYVDGVVDAIRMDMFGDEGTCTSSLRPPTPGGSGLHPLGLARDYRTRGLTHAEQRRFAARVREVLDNRFDVILEGPASEVPRYQNRAPHLHVELDVQ